MYSCSDFTDSALGSLGITVPEEHRDNPGEQFKLAQREIERLQACAAELATARELIEDAMANHIYDEANGEKPDADCGYQAFLDRAAALVGKVQ